MGDSSINVNLPSASFIAPTRVVRVNCFFLASLSCSLLTALGAVLGKQWLAYYDQENQLRQTSERGRDRHRKYLGAKTWHLKAVIETLPTLLQFSFFLFFAAQIDLFWYIHQTVATVIIVFASLTFSFYAITTLIAVFAFGSPFQTRFSALLRRVKLRVTRLHDEEDEDDVIGAQCVDWLLETTNLPDALVASVKAVAKLLDRAREKIGFDVIEIMKLVVKPIDLGTKVELGISTESLRSCLPGVVGLIHRTDDFSWQDILPTAELTHINSSLCDALLKVYQSYPSDVQLGRCITGLFATIPLENSIITTDFHALYAMLLHNLPSFSSSTQPYADLVTICLLVKHSASTSLVAEILGVHISSLKEYIISHSLDPFFIIPALPEDSLRLVNRLPMHLTKVQDPASPFQTTLPLAELTRIKALLYRALRKLYQSNPCDTPLAMWIAGFIAPLQLQGPDVPTELEMLYMLLLHNLPSISPSHQSYTELTALCLLTMDSTPTSFIGEVLDVPFASLKEHISFLTLDPLFEVPASPEEPFRLNHRSLMHFVATHDSTIELATLARENNTRITKSYLECLVTSLGGGIAANHGAAYIRYQDYPQDLPNTITPTLHLSSLHWPMYLSLNPNHKDQTILTLMAKLLETHLLRWLEVLVHCKKLGTAVRSLKRAENWLSVCHSLPSSIKITEPMLYT